MSKLQVWNNSKREWALVGVLVGVVLAIAAYVVGTALAQ